MSAKSIPNPTEIKIGPKPAANQGVLKDFVRVLVFPLIINKMFMMYFGLNYSNFPGEGYGYGLAATIAFLLITIGRFVWKYRDVEDP